MPFRHAKGKIMLLVKTLESCPILRLLQEAKICNFRYFVKKWLCWSNVMTNFYYIDTKV